MIALNLANGTYKEVYVPEEDETTDKSIPFQTWLCV